ncbi:MAG: GntR family transcriptional regulator [Oscillospiraceae bacterium]|jgi:GntR family transcriptional regulator|nr:GntR family transcriptional regulator [Oscillospiraceae bacterium]
MIIIDFHSRVPLYEQIKEQIMLLVQQGLYQPNDQLPSIRVLSKQLRLNVNTVKRALGELEEMGVTYSLPGRGVFVSENALGNKKIKQDAAAKLKTAMQSAKAKGLSKQEVETLTAAVFAGKPNS